MNYNPHKCAICEKEKHHGCVCAVKGYRGMMWICFECQKKIEGKESEGE